MAGPPSHKLDAFTYTGLTLDLKREDSFSHHYCSEGTKSMSPRPTSRTLGGSTPTARSIPFGASRGQELVEAEDFSGFEVGLQLPVHRIRASSTMSRKRALRRSTSAGVLKIGESMTGVPSSWTDPRSGSRRASMGRNCSTRRSRPSGRISRDDQQIDIRLVSWSAAPDGAEHGHGYQAIAIPSTELGEHRLEEGFVVLEE